MAVEGASRPLCSALPDRAAEDWLRHPDRHLAARTAAGLGRVPAGRIPPATRGLSAAGAHPAEVAGTPERSAQLGLLAVGRPHVPELARGAGATSGRAFRPAQACRAFPRCCAGDPAPLWKRVMSLARCT